jgi:hypothetical protein
VESAALDALDPHALRAALGPGAEDLLAAARHVRHRQAVAQDELHRLRAGLPADVPVILLPELPLGPRRTVVGGLVAALAEELTLS